MGIDENTLRRALPRGALWVLGGDGGAFLAGVAKCLERLRADAAAIVDESRPGTATVTLKEWHEALSQPYDETLPVATQRARLEAFLTSAGGATLEKLQAQIDLEFDGITISEVSAISRCGVARCGTARCSAEAGTISPTYYLVSGTLENFTDAIRLSRILARFAPLHLVPVSSLTILSETAVSICGLARCGIARCGKSIT